MQGSRVPEDIGKYLSPILSHRTQYFGSVNCYIHISLLGELSLTADTLIYNIYKQNCTNSTVYVHITLNTPVLVQSLKLSKVELC